MPDNILHMTPDQIRTRLQAIGAEQARHAARDLDAELAKGMREGGDLDAIEASHLEAERASRRLRVERSALEDELPISLAREAASEIDLLVERHGALAVTAEQAATNVADTWSAFVASVHIWRDVQTDGEAITLRAASLSKNTQAPMPSGLGIFNSARVIGVVKEWHQGGQELISALATAEKSVDTGIGDFSKRFAKTMLPAEANDNQPVGIRA